MIIMGVIYSLFKINEKIGICYMYKIKQLEYIKSLYMYNLRSLLRIIEQRYQKNKKIKLSNYIIQNIFLRHSAGGSSENLVGHKEIEGLLEEQFLLLLLPKTDLQCQIKMCIYYLFIWSFSPFFSFIMATLFWYSGRTMSYSAIKL